MLQINLVIEDAKISLDELQEDIAEFEDYVQSTDVAAMQSEFENEFLFCGRDQGVLCADQAERLPLPEL